MPAIIRENGLAWCFGLLFAATLVGQAFTGHTDHNNQLISEGLHPISLVRYVTSSTFTVDVAENWQSEYLQFLLYILATVWLVQRGSPESKPLGKEGIESDQEQKVGEHALSESPRWAKTRGFRLSVYSRSLALLMGAIFAASWLAQSVTGRVAYTRSW